MEVWAREDARAAPKQLVYEEKNSSSNCFQAHGTSKKRLGVSKPLSIKPLNVLLGRLNTKNPEDQRERQPEYHVCPVHGNKKARHPPQKSKQKRDKCPQDVHPKTRECWAAMSQKTATKNQHNGTSSSNPQLSCTTQHRAQCVLGRIGKAARQSTPVSGSTGVLSTATKRS